MKFSPVWILAICHNFTAITGYNIDIETVRVVSEPTNQDDSLFGWKMEYFNKDLYVSAPQALNNGRKDGEVYKCPEDRKCFFLSRDSARVGNDSNIWFGGELVSEAGSMYACAPRTNQPRTLTLMTFIGSCYKYNSGTSRFDLFETFHDPSKYKFTSPGGKKVFFGVGIYGFSATISDSGSLIVGGPYNPQLDGSQIHLYTGLITEVERGQIKFPSSNPTPPFSYGNGISRWTHPNYFLAGYFVGKGKFSDGERELIIGAPGADFHTGKIYVCGNCNGIRSDFKNQELKGSTGGEGFGFTSAACDINGDGKDDLLIGAPFYTANNKYYDTGAVYVYTNRWNKNDRFKFNLEKTNLLGEEMIKKVSGAMFGRSIACLGDTDLDGKQEVVVGAPFYGETDKPGAIFIFKSFLKPDSLDTEPSQIIYGTSPEFSGPSGFGFRFAVPDFTGDSINFDNTQPSPSRAEEFSVSAPHSRQVFKLKFKKVIRINDTTRPMLYCYNENDVKTLCLDHVEAQTKRLELVVQPRISNPPLYSDLLAEVLITADPKVSETTRSKALTTNIITSDSTVGNSVSFFFEPNSKWQSSFSDGLSGEGFSLKLGLTLQYRIVCDSPPCPMFPKEPRPGVNISNDERLISSKTTISPDITACGTVNCDCSMEYQLIRYLSTIVSGELRTNILGFLKISNKGPELSHSNMVNITILNSNITQVIPDDIVGRCLKVEGKLVCSLKALMKDDRSSVKLEIGSPSGFIPEPQLDIRVSASSACSKKVFSEDLRIDIKQNWAISATPTSADKTLIWRENTPDRNKEELQIVKHEFQISNSGPSMSSESQILVFLPSDHPLINEASVVLGGNVCTEEGDLEFRRIPPQPQALPHQNVENVFCSVRAMCRVISCKLATLYPSTSNSIMLSVNYNFSIGGAENSSMSVFQLATGVITVDYRNKESKSVSSSTYEFSATTFLEEVLNYYEVIMALVACIVLIVLINFVFKYFDVFNKVRIYKNKLPDEGLELMDNNEDITEDKMSQKNINNEVGTTGVVLRN